MARHSLASILGVLVVCAACGGESPTEIDGSGSDGGGVDAAGPGLDSGAGDVDSGAGDADSGAGDVDSGGPGTDGGGLCVPGTECTGYPAALAAAARGATSVDNCVVQLHQRDCCGAMDANAVNHDARTALCSAESACTATYPTPAGCSDTTITTDTGDTTTDMGDVRLRVVDPTPCSFDPAVTCYTCETFVCSGGSCSTAPGIAGGCGP